MEAQASEAADLLLGTQQEPEAPEGVKQPAQGSEVSPSEGKGSRPLELPAEGQPEKGPLTVKGLAEKLGMSAKEVYESLTIDVGEGLTLGQIKDRAKDLTRSDELLAEIEAKRIRTDQDLLRKQQAMDLLGLKLTPEQQAEADSRRDEVIRAESLKVLDQIPEWGDPTTKAKDVQAIHELFAGYGFSQVELNGVVDHRLIKAMNDMQRLMGRITAVKTTEVKEPRPQGQRNRSQAAVNPTSKAVQGFKDGTLSRDNAVAALIADG